MTSDDETCRSGATFATRPAFWAALASRPNVRVVHTHVALDFSAAMHEIAAEQSDWKREPRWGRELGDLALASTKTNFENFALKDSRIAR